jgi:leader peptidase (prepilin peptidase)/N-methyltransferase
MAFIFAFGACVGSFLNVVVYRLPREKSLVWPGSACPSCNTAIQFYDNIPIFSWLILGAKCRYCKKPISARYVLIELFTACLFLGVYLWFFYAEGRKMGFVGDMAIQRFFSGGWLVYLSIMTLVAAFVAASAIDLELWIIPLGLCWFVTAVGIVAATAAGWVIPTSAIDAYFIFPMATIKQAAIAGGAVVGLIISLIGLRTGIIKPSYPYPEGHEKLSEDKNVPEPEFNDRFEMLKELLFLFPIILGGICGYMLLRSETAVEAVEKILQVYAIKGLVGSLMGYLMGCATVWTARVLGTLAFGREAMGLGDVHLMGAAGAVIGPWMVVLAFFLAPFFGLIWALYQWIFKNSRQIPYGPFLSTAVFVVIICNDWIRNVFLTMYGF